MYTYICFLLAQIIIWSETRSPCFFRYSSLAAARNGRLYAAPFGASRVLEVDPAEGATRLIGVALPGKNKCKALSAASNGCLYAFPFELSRVLEIDPAEGATRLIGAEIPAVERSYSSPVLAGNGRLYAAPRTALRVLEIDPYAMKRSWLALVRQIDRAERAYPELGLLTTLAIHAPGLCILARFESYLSPAAVLAFL